ncbi:unnamed protein product [Closterium sp. NIES-64]|nr:unnamed protein product [Closterium sp. NIES-64]
MHVRTGGAVVDGGVGGWVGGWRGRGGRGWVGRYNKVLIVATSLDIALSSFSLALVTRTFYSMWRVVLPVAGETEFELLGFILVMLASFTAVRPPSTPTGLTNLLLTLLQYLAPVMALVCGIFSLLHEPWSSLASLPYFDTWPHALWTLAVMPVGGVLAFCMVGGCGLQLILTCAAIHQHEFR